LKTGKKTSEKKGVGKDKVDRPIENRKLQKKVVHLMTSNWSEKKNNKSQPRRGNEAAHVRGPTKNGASTLPEFKEGGSGGGDNGKDEAKTSGSMSRKTLLIMVPTPWQAKEMKKNHGATELLFRNVSPVRIRG